MSKKAYAGEHKWIPLESVAPNPWNPNRLTDFLQRSLEHGLNEDGWIASQAMLIWGTDDKGEAKNLIIDGEHRWKAAHFVGLDEGPAYILHGVSERDAKALTIKLDQKRGKFNPERLDALVGELDLEDIGISLGLELEPPAPKEEQPEQDVIITYTLSPHVAEELRDLLAQVAKKHELETLSAAAMFAYEKATK